MNAFDPAAAKTALAALAVAASTRRAAPLVRRFLPDIEAAQAAGATIPEILAAFAQSGLAINDKTFRSALYRARKRRQRERTPSGAPLGANAPAPATPVPAQPVSKVRNPADLRRLRREPIDLEALENYARERRSPST